MNILDYVFLSFLGLAFIIGLWKGISGLLFSCLSMIFVSLTVAVAGGYFVGKQIYTTQLGDSVQTSIYENIQSKSDVFSRPLEVNEDSQVLIVLENGEKVFLAEGVETALGKDLSKVSTFAINYWGKLMVKNGSIVANATIVDLVSPWAALIIVQIIFGFICFIVTLILILILRRLSDAIEENKAAKAISKVLGVAVSVGVTLMMFIAVLSVFYKFQDKSFLSSVINYINESKIVSKLYNSEIVKKLIP